MPRCNRSGRSRRAAVAEAVQEAAVAEAAPTDARARRRRSWMRRARVRLCMRLCIVASRYARRPERASPSCPTSRGASKLRVQSAGAYS